MRKVPLLRGPVCFSLRPLPKVTWHTRNIWAKCTSLFQRLFSLCRLGRKHSSAHVQWLETLAWFVIFAFLCIAQSNDFFNRATNGSKPLLVPLGLGFLANWCFVHPIPQIKQTHPRASPWCRSFACQSQSHCVCASKRPRQPRVQEPTSLGQPRPPADEDTSKRKQLKTSQACNAHLHLILSKRPISWRCVNIFVIYRVYPISST